MEQFVEWAMHGLNAPDLGISIMRFVFGMFFFLSGANKLLVAERHAALVRTLEQDGVPKVKFMQWWVPGWEFAAGMMLMLGILSSFSATVLLIICAVACCCEARQRVEAYKPINAADRVDDYLYLPEFIYLIGLLGIALSGGGAYGFDAML